MAQAQVKLVLQRRQPPQAYVLSWPLTPLALLEVVP